MDPADGVGDTDIIRWRKSVQRLESQVLWWFAHLKEHVCLYDMLFLESSWTLRLYYVAEISPRSVAKERLLMRMRGLWLSWQRTHGSCPRPLRPPQPRWVLATFEMSRKSTCTCNVGFQTSYNSLIKCGRCVQPEIEEDGSLEAMGDALAALLGLDGRGSDLLHRECCNFITNFARMLGFKVSKVAARLVPALVDRLRFESQVRSSLNQEISFRHCEDCSLNQTF